MLANLTAQANHPAVLKAVEVGFLPALVEWARHPGPFDHSTRINTQTVLLTLQSAVSIWCLRAASCRRFLRRCSPSRSKQSMTSSPTYLRPTSLEKVRKSHVELFCADVFVTAPVATPSSYDLEDIRNYVLGSLYSAQSAASSMAKSTWCCATHSFPLAQTRPVQGGCVDRCCLGALVC